VGRVRSVSRFFGIRIEALACSRDISVPVAKSSAVRRFQDFEGLNLLFAKHCSTGIEIPLSIASKEPDGYPAVFDARLARPCGAPLSAQVQETAPSKSGS